MINVPSNIIFDIASTTQATMSTMWDLTAVFIALPLTFWALKKIIGLFPKK